MLNWMTHVVVVTLVAQSHSHVVDGLGNMERARFALLMATPRRHAFTNDCS